MQSTLKCGRLVILNIVSLNIEWFTTIDNNQFEDLLKFSIPHGNYIEWKSDRSMLVYARLLVCILCYIQKFKNY